MTEPDVHIAVTVDGSKAFAALKAAHDLLTELHMQLSWPIRIMSLPRTFRTELVWERHGGRVSRLRAAWRAACTVARIARGR